MSKFSPSDYPKFRKQQKHASGKILGCASEKARKLCMCPYGLRVLEGVRLSPEQLEAMRKVLVNKLGRYMIINFRVFAHKPITEKPIAVRMGGGKGSPSKWRAIVKAGQVILEVGGEASEDKIKEAIFSAAKKIGCQTQIIDRRAI